LPAQQPVSSTLIAALQQAIKQEGTVTISYQALGDRKATYREIQPLRLEQHGKLFYLYAYCYRAESNLTFRLDRIKEMRNEG
jgi:predicted DNA-binding transcriptional regulator YafY